MNRIFLISILCVFHKNVLASEDLLTPEQKAMIANLHKNCVEETGVAEDLISNAAKGNFAEEKPLKCYMLCLLTSIGIMEEDGTFDHEAYVELLPESMQAHGKNVVAKCKDVVKPGDGCESAFTLNKCTYDVDPAKYLLF